MGKTGRQGSKGDTRPLNVKDVLELLVTHFDDVYRQLNLQMKLIAKMQEQLGMMGPTPGRRIAR